MSDGCNDGNGGIDNGLTENETQPSVQIAEFLGKRVVVKRLLERRKVSSEKNVLLMLRPRARRSKRITMSVMHLDLRRLWLSYPNLRFNRKTLCSLQ